MTKHKYHPHQHVGPHGENAPERRPPYWRTMHRDWRAWCIMLLMVAAMLGYLFAGTMRRNVPVPLNPPAPAVSP